MSGSSFEQIKPIDLAEVRAQKAADLQAMLREKRRQYEDARFALRSGQMRKPHIARQIRKDMARVATILTGMTRTATEAGAQQDKGAQEP